MSRVIGRVFKEVNVETKEDANNVANSDGAVDVLDAKTVTELKEMAKEMMLPVKEGMKKQDIIDLINAETKEDE